MLIVYQLYMELLGMLLSSSIFRSIKYIFIKTPESVNLKLRLLYYILLFSFQSAPN